MRRILLVLTVATAMVAMQVVLAVPAFADKGQRGHESTDVLEGCTTFSEPCHFTSSSSGFGRGHGPTPSGGGGGGRTTLDVTFTPVDQDFNITGTQSGGGGGPGGGGGGRCVQTLDTSAPEPLVTTEHGSDPICLFSLEEEEL